MKLEFSIAVIAFTALAVQTYLNLADALSLLHCVWKMMTFFTILTNLAVALVMTRAVIRNKLPSPRISGALTVWMIVVGTVGHGFMHKEMPAEPIEVWVDYGLHTIVPIMTIAWWVVRARKDGLTLVHVGLWTLYPSLYMIYAATRGAAEESYPYFFIDPNVSSNQTIALWLAALTVLFLVVGLALVALSRSQFFQRV